MTEPTAVRKAQMYMLVGEETLAEHANFRDHLLRALNDPGSIPPPLPDPGSHPAHLALVDAVRDSPVLTALVELHQPHARCYPATIHWQCQAETDGDDYADWPCETVAVIAHHAGVELPRGWLDAETSDEA